MQDAARQQHSYHSQKSPSTGAAHTPAAATHHLQTQAAQKAAAPWLSSTGQGWGGLLSFQPQKTWAVPLKIALQRGRAICHPQLCRPQLCRRRPKTCGPTARRGRQALLPKQPRLEERAVMKSPRSDRCPPSSASRPTLSGLHQSCCLDACAAVPGWCICRRSPQAQFQCPAPGRAPGRVG